jgi:hypothetical protein
MCTLCTHISNDYRKRLKLLCLFQKKKSQGDIKLKKKKL